MNPTGGNTYILNKEIPDVVKWRDILFPLTNGWTAIPLDVIINEENIEYELKVEDGGEIQIGDTVTADGMNIAGMVSKIIDGGTLEITNSHGCFKRPKQCYYKARLIPFNSNS